MSAEDYNAIILLEDGTTFYGVSSGKPGVATGEICFNTGMTGYQEVFTDPSYFGQVMITTNVHIGNYGVLADDEESDEIQISGLICRNFTSKYSRKMADDDVKNYFYDRGIVVVSDVDTRALVRHIRDKGAMNVVIACESNLSAVELQELVKATPRMTGLELASKVSTKAGYPMGNPEADTRIAVMDYGTKRNILKNFIDRGCYVKVFPAKTNYDTVKEWNPDGVFLSNGPGDPASMDYAVAFTKKLLEDKIPTFGICLGHQILALALDIPTFKMHHGHRGINHPVKNLNTGKCEITSQNHGFGVRAKELEEKEDQISVSHINLNDNSVEGIRHKYLPAFSVQYHPEAAPGPHDSMYLFDEFIELIKNHKK